MPHCLATWGSMVCSVAELATVLTVLATVLLSWRVLYSNSGGFEGEGVVVGGASSDRLEEAVDGDPYGVQWQAWQASRPRVPKNTGVVVAVPGVVLQARGRSHRTNSGRDGASSRRPDVMV
jgi:hypothetical protein